MKSIDIKSLLIGIFMTSTIFLGIGAAGAGDTQEVKIANWPVAISAVPMHVSATVQQVGKWEVTD